MKRKEPGHHGQHQEDRHRSHHVTVFKAHEGMNSRGGIEEKDLKRRLKK